MNNFTHKLFSASLCAVVALPAAAQFHSREAAPAKTQPKTMSVFNVAANDSKQGQFRLLSVAAKADSQLPYSEYGEVVDILNEDFSKMTTGSIESPDTDTDINYENKNNAWINMLGDYTQMFGWGSHNAYPAGGCLYLDASEGESQVNTPLLDLSGNDQIALIQFDAFTKSSSFISTLTFLEAAETNDMGPSWDNLGSALLPAIKGEKQTFTYLFYGAGPSTIFNICAKDESIFVDNIRVYQIAQTVGTPTTAKHRYYNGQDFNLVWNKVSNADSYVLNVYTTDSEGNPVNYLLEDFDTQSSDTTYTVRNAKSGETYHYTISSKKGGKVSIASEPFEVYDVATPVLKNVATPADGKYTAAWDSVPGAERYNYTALYKRVAEQDGTQTLTSLYFPGMKYNDGTEPTYSTDNSDTYSYDEGVLQDVQQAGWTARHYAVYKDALALDAFWYVNNKEMASLESPEFDLSHNDGKFTVSTRLCGEYLQYYKAYPRGAVALFNYDEETDELVQAEAFFATDVNGKWKDYTYNFTEGTEKSVVALFGIYAPGNLYVENLKIDQDYKQGESFLDPFYSQQYVQGKSIEVPLWNVAEKVDGKDIYHTIQAVRTPTEQDQYAGYYKRVYSDWSEPTLVAANVNGIQKATVTSKNHASLTMEGENLVVNNPKGEAVTVYGLNGAQVFSNASGSATVSIPMPQHGTYIVKVGKQSIKFTL